MHKSNGSYRLLIVFNYEANNKSGLKVGWSLGKNNRRGFKIADKGRDQIQTRSSDFTTNALASITDILRQIPEDKNEHAIDIYLDDVNFFENISRFRRDNVQPVSQAEPLQEKSAYELKEFDHIDQDLERIRKIISMDSNALHREIKTLELAKTAPQIQDYSTYKQVLRILMQMQTFCNGHDIHLPQKIQISDSLKQKDKFNSLNAQYIKDIENLQNNKQLDENALQKALEKICEKHVQETVRIGKDNSEQASVRQVNTMNGLNELYISAMKQVNNATKHKRSTANSWMISQLIALRAL